ncbi:O-antigen polymerase [Stutzerimonas degradans]
MNEFRIDDVFFSIVAVGWLASAFLLFFSYIRYRIFTFFDAGIAMSWFFVFFRPLNIFNCDINIDLYFWDESLYVRGAFISIAMTLVCQLSSLLVSRKSLKPDFCFDQHLFRKRIEGASLTIFLYCIVVVFLMFLMFGYQVFPSNRGEGALSVSMPGLEIFYHTLRALTLVLIIFSAVSLFVFKSTKSFIFAVFSIATLLIFAKRNSIINPLIYLFFIYSYYYVYFLGGSILRLFVVMLPLILFLVFIALFGKAFKSEEGFNFERPSDGYACYVVRQGMQEFDLFWPAVLEVGGDKINFFDLPFAVWGALTHDHSSRIKSEYLSVTDKTMLKFNYDNYAYKKFGITPSFLQFYYYYFWLWGAFVAAVLAFLARKLEFWLVRSFYQGWFGSFLCALAISKFVLSSFDFTIKYSAFEFVVFLVIYIGIASYFFLSNRFPQRKNSEGACV